MFSGIEHTTLTLHTGYTKESFLIHIEALPSARDNKWIPVRISSSSSIHVLLVQNEQVEPVLFPMKSSLCQVTMQLSDSDIGITCLARSILLLAHKTPRLSL